MLINLLKKLFILVICILFIVSCKSEYERTEEELTILKGKVQQSRDILSGLESDLKRKEPMLSQIAGIKAQISNSAAELGKLNADIAEARKIADGKGYYVYIVKFELSQSRISLDIGEHIKDAMNKISFELPVSEQYFNSVNTGTEIVEQFRIGSILMSGTFGEWNMKVIDKRRVMESKR